MLTNPEAGVSELDADAITARMAELEDDQPQETEEAEVEAEEQELQPQDDELEEIEWQDGKKYKIPKAVKPGLMLQSDYTKKTQSLAEQRKAFEQHERAVQAERQYYANQLSQITQQLSQAIQQGPSEEQLIELSKRDPVAYIQARAERDMRMAQLAQAQQQQDVIRQQQDSDQKRQQSEYIANERNTLLSKLPEWKDNSIAEREMKEMAEYAQSVGYTPEELANVYNHRDYLVLRDAMRYRQLQSQKPNQQQPAAPKVLKPGAAQTPNASKVSAEVVKRFKGAPTIENMAKILERL